MNYKLPLEDELLALSESGDIEFAFKKSQHEVIRTSNELKPKPIISVTKQFTGAAILLSDIDINSDISMFFPELKSTTLLDLLNHTSGIDEYLYLPSESKLDKWSLSECCQFICDLPRLNTKSYFYSNSNFVLLSKILEMAHDMPYGDVVQDLIFTPCNMNLSKAREKINGSFNGFGDACILSTALDLIAWSESEVCKTYLDKISRLHLDAEYQCGLFKIESKNVYFHTGSKPGYFAFNLIDRQEDFSVALTTSDENTLIKTLKMFGLLSE